MAPLIEADYRVTTPLFGAGAETSEAELRSPSIKGVLRFWWRAHAWTRYNGDLEMIKLKEDDLFGSSRTGQSRVLMRLIPPSVLTTVPIGSVLTKSDKNIIGEGARYLGYGVMEAYPRSPKDGRPATKAGELSRACLRAPFDFAIQLRTRDLDQESLSSLISALITVGTLGGIGAKSRKGYGSLSLRSLRIDDQVMWSAPDTVNGLMQAIATLNAECLSDDLPEFTALSKKTRHVLLSAAVREPVDLLDLIGRELVRFRSHGHKGKILGGAVDSEKLFQDDHDLMKTCPTDRTSHPRRIAFGLPHNYGPTSDQKVSPYDKTLDRRASPLFIHIHECGVTPVAVLSFLPAGFLPKGKSDISVGGKQITQTPEAELYRPILEFFDRLLDASQRKEPFKSALEVKQ